MEPLLLAIIIGAFGGTASSIIAWLSGNEPFIPRKFAYGVIRGAIGGIIIALAFPIQDTPKDLILLFLSALGIDTSVYKAGKIIRGKQAK